MASELGARGGASPAGRGGGRSRRGLLRGATGLGAGAALGAACGAPGGPAGPPERAPVTLDFLSHWAAADLEGFQKDADDYRAGGASHVTITSQTIPYAELRQKTLVLASSGTRPDLYATYALWLREFQRLKLLAGAPGDAAATIKRLYSASLVEAVTSEGKVLGFPRDPNTYLLLYGKQALRQAGVARPPETWDEWKSAAQAATERTEGGRKGLTVITGWDSGVVHPLTALIWTNGGEFAAKDGAKVAFDGPRALEALQLQVDLIRSGAALTGPTSTFAQDKSAMIVMANWWHDALKRAKGDFYEDVGVAPLPRGKGKQTTLMYVWLYGVDAASKAGGEAWRFLSWLNSPKAPGDSSREGDRHAAKGTIPPATADFTYHSKGLLGAPFLQPFIQSLSYARAEDPIFNGDLVKRTLQLEAEAAFAGQKTAQQAMADAAREANRLIAEQRG
jgi:multiple sugar transport system substrate-binding protein